MSLSYFSFVRTSVLHLGFILYKILARAYVLGAPTSSSVLSSNFQSQTSLSQNIPENTNQNHKTLNHKKKILDMQPIM